MQNGVKECDYHSILLNITTTGRTSRSVGVMDNNHDYEKVLTSNTMKISDVNACMFHRWYDTFSSDTPKSKILPLTETFKDYLLSDGVFLPASTAETSRLIEKASLDDDNDENLDDWNNDDTSDDQAPDFGGFEEDVETAIADLGGAVLPKLNWSAPQDAAWMSFDHTLKCTCVADVCILLKSSDFIARDLTQPFVLCDDFDGTAGSPGVSHYLVLREWIDIQAGLEFRCFVRNNRFAAIAQRHFSKYYEFIPTMKEDIVRGLVKFFATRISGNFPLDNYVFDVYRDRNKRWRLVDFNPFGPVTDSPLFSWSELLALTDTTSTPEFRYIESYGLIRPCPYASNSLPRDVVDLSTGQDANKMIDLLKLQQKTQNRDSSSSDDDDDDDDDISPGVR